MNDQTHDSLYQAFGKLVRLHRERLDGMTQEKLAQFVGLSRTSVTNIEKGRQHVSLHHIFAIAQALRVDPEALLPSMGRSGRGSRMAGKLPPGTETDIAEWAETLVTEKPEQERP